MAAFNRAEIKNMAGCLTCETNQHGVTRTPFMCIKMKLSQQYRSINNGPVSHIASGGKKVVAPDEATLQ